MTLVFSFSLGSLGILLSRYLAERFLGVLIFRLLFSRLVSVDLRFLFPFTLLFSDKVSEAWAFVDVHFYFPVPVLYLTLLQGILCPGEQYLPLLIYRLFLVFSKLSWGAFVVLPLLVVFPQLWVYIENS